MRLPQRRIASLTLFRNRAELKKAYGELQDESLSAEGPHQAAGRGDRSACRKCSTRSKRAWA